MKLFDIFEKEALSREIGIDDGYAGWPHFGIMPVRIRDYSDTNNRENVERLNDPVISVRENDAAQFLLPFLRKNFDNELEANKKRVESSFTDRKADEGKTFLKGFIWNPAANYYTHDTIHHILSDIRETIKALDGGTENEYTKILRIKRGLATYELIYSDELSEEQIREYNKNRPKEDETPAEIIIDFYHRFIRKMEQMMQAGKETGYDLIMFVRS